MAVEQSVELLSFNFASRTFAHKRLAQGINWSLSASISVIRENFDFALSAVRCAQYVNDIGVAAQTASGLIENIELVFKQVQKAGSKLSIEKRPFGIHSIELLGKTIFKAAIALTEEWITKFLKNLKLPSFVKLLQLFLGFVNFCRQYIRRPFNKLVPLHLLLQKDVPFNLTQAQKDAIFEISECLLKTSKIYLKLHYRKN